ncbi:MAG: ComEC/Rec2 family competence protein [Campylobacterota bacterium]|nr:ComEC/Rec2 family competence protein [Campylobacterota bacterium]
MEKLNFFQNKKERFFVYSLLLIIFSLNILSSYNKYLTFIDEEIFNTEAYILNIYPKKNYFVIKLKTDDFICYTVSKTRFEIYQNINISLLTKNISFYDYIKTFYTNSFNIKYTNNKIDYSLKSDILEYIQNQHNHNLTTSLYEALYLAKLISKELRVIVSNYGVSHLIAISGFHLGIIVTVLYFLLYILYSPIHKIYFPYRNKKVDILISSSIILFLYLIMIDISPSFLRSFVMFVLGLYLLRSNIKLISFETLLIITLIIISIFPSLLFSLGLWLSITGVFYIFLFIKYFNNLNKYLQFILFNYWLFFVMNPIIHYIFYTTSIEQLYSPILTILFSLFYPISLFLHFINQGDLFDNILLIIPNIKINSYEVITPLWLFISYIFISILSIWYKNSFILLNIILVLFNGYLFLR